MAGRATRAIPARLPRLSSVCAAAGVVLLLCRALSVELPRSFTTGAAQLLRPPTHRISALRRRAEAESVETETASPRVLLVVTDSNPYLSESTKTAMKHAIGVASKGHLTALVLPSGEGAAATNTTTLQNSLRFYFDEAGLSEDQWEELVPAPDGATCSATVVADTADEFTSTDVVISAEAVAKKDVDASLLATFLSCRLVLVPA
eukprot:TRINITY_DN105133_c0_g1_i1.p1 TRINITY_DN105133_c0_g1~~TRINITY_DN105133_c0_g1_i1.p1  ORF type:complete len:230 (-),score=36.82 TRINITY_DN105133_c0_g1_i1:445-1059(-)